MRTTNSDTRENGFTMMEVLASMVIFSICAAALVGSFTQQIRHNHQSSLRSAATVAAQRTLDDYRIQDIGDIPTSGSANTNVTIGTRDFEVVTYFCNDSTLCSTNNRHLAVVVRFHDQDLYDVETVFTQLR